MPKKKELDFSQLKKHKNYSLPPFRLINLNFYACCPEKIMLIPHNKFEKVLNLKAT